MYFGKCCWTKIVKKRRNCEKKYTIQQLLTKVAIVLYCIGSVDSLQQLNISIFKNKITTQQPYKKFPCKSINHIKKVLCLAWPGLQMGIQMNGYCELRRFSFYKAETKISPAQDFLPCGWRFENYFLYWEI